MTRWTATALLAAALVVGVAGPARAHAELLTTTPADGESLETSPDEVVVAFSEPVTAPVAAIRVFSTDGARVDDGDIAGSGSTTLRTSLDPDLDQGWYVVSWSAVSADDHPIRGAFLFEVGSGEEAPGQDVIAGILGGDHRGAALTGAVARWFTYAGWLVAVGAAAMLLSLRAGPTRDAVRALVLVAAAVAALGSVVAVMAQAAETTGLGTGVLGSPELLLEGSGGVGRAALIRLVGLGVLALAVTGKVPARVFVPAAGVVIAGADLLTGHTTTADPRWLVMSADFVHVGAAACWVGGLAALLLATRAMRRDGDAAGAAQALGSFSRLAVASVAALTAAGAVLGWRTVRSFDALTSTTYGRTLIVKLVLAVGVIGAGVYNNRVLVPRLAADAPVGDDGDRWRRLWRNVGGELVGLAAVLAVTAALVNIVPAASAAGITGPFDTYVPLGDDGSQVNLVVDPNQAGANQVHAYLIDPSGRPADIGEGAVFELSMPEQDIGPIVREPAAVGVGHYLLVGSELAIPGTWRIEVVVRLSAFEDARAVADVPVNP